MINKSEKKKSNTNTLPKKDKNSDTNTLPKKDKEIEIVSKRRSQRAKSFFSNFSLSIKEKIKNFISRIYTKKNK